MKLVNLKTTCSLLAGLFLITGLVQGQINLPADATNLGTDQSLAPLADSGIYEIDLSQAQDGPWNAPGGGSGIYDKDKWAVVFKYASVNIPADVTVRFINHPSRAPVVWIVNGDVTISGRLNLDGGDGAVGLVPSKRTEPGPGGFHGGTGYRNPAAPRSVGFGIGGGTNQRFSDGSYATRGANTGANVYGNPRILPLIGGSGGTGVEDQPRDGGGGGGAILIVATGTLTLDGDITARGGAERHYYAGSGSGGAVRLVADLIAGNGRVLAHGTGGSGHGRIRIETNGIVDGAPDQPGRTGRSGDALAAGGGAPGKGRLGAGPDPTERPRC